jgi:hypothetical protein
LLPELVSLLPWLPTSGAADSTEIDVALQNVTGDRVVILIENEAIAEVHATPRRSRPDVECETG